MGYRRDSIWKGLKLDTRELYKAILDTPILANRYNIISISAKLANLFLPEGCFVEFGVGEGDSLYTLLNTGFKGKVYGFDTFEGLPEDWHRGNGITKKGTFKPKRDFNLPPNTCLIKGLFSDSLYKENYLKVQEKISLLHIDCDLYSSTKDILDSYCMDKLVENKSIILFDELCNFSGTYINWRKGEWKALVESNLLLTPLCRTNHEQVAFIYNKRTS